jgi:hypothetical protein
MPRGVEAEAGILETPKPKVDPIAPMTELVCRRLVRIRRPEPAVTSGDEVRRRLIRPGDTVSNAGPL